MLLSLDGFRFDEILRLYSYNLNVKSGRIFENYYEKIKFY